MRSTKTTQVKRYLLILQDPDNRIHTSLWNTKKDATKYAKAMKGFLVKLKLKELKIEVKIK